MKDNTRGLSPQWKTSEGSGNLGDYTVKTKELEQSDLLEMVKDSRVADYVATLINNQVSITLTGRQTVAVVKAEVKAALEENLGEGQSLPKQEEWMAKGKPIAIAFVKDYLAETTFDFKQLIEVEAKEEKKTKLSPLEAMVKDLCDKREAAGKDRNEALIREKVAAILALKDLE